MLQKKQWQGEVLDSRFNQQKKSKFVGENASGPGVCGSVKSGPGIRDFSFTLKTAIFNDSRMKNPGSGPVQESRKTPLGSGTRDPGTRTLLVGTRILSKLNGLEKIEFSSRKLRIPASGAVNLVSKSG